MLLLLYIVFKIFSIFIGDYFRQLYGEHAGWANSVVVTNIMNKYV